MLYEAESKMSMVTYAFCVMHNTIDYSSVSGINTIRCSTNILCHFENKQALKYVIVEIIFKLKEIFLLKWQFQIRSLLIAVILLAVCTEGVVINQNGLKWLMNKILRTKTCINTTTIFKMNTKYGSPEKMKSIIVTRFELVLLVKSLSVQSWKSMSPSGDYSIA